MREFISEHFHCLMATGTSTATAASLLTNVEDLLLRGIVSVVVGVATWCITQLLSKALKK